MEVKQKLETLKGFDPAVTKLVCQGKLLQNNEQTLTEYNIKKNDFLVVMVPKVKAPPKKPDAKPAAATTSTTSQPAAPAAPAAASSEP